jgi:hypothetical protein
LGFLLVNSFPRPRSTRIEPRRAALRPLFASPPVVGSGPLPGRSRECYLRFWGWEPSLLYVTEIRTARSYEFWTKLARTCQNVPELARSRESEHASIASSPSSQGLGTCQTCQHWPELASACQNTATVTEMVASTGEVHHTIAKKLSLAGHQREVAETYQV